MRTGLLFISTIAVLSSAIPANATLIEGMPDAIICKMPALGGRPAGSIIFYIDAATDDGTYYYRTLGQSSLSFTVDKSGKVNAGKIEDCNGKTVEQLKADGQAK